MVKQPVDFKNYIFHTSTCYTDLVQFVGDSSDDGLVSEVEMEPLEIHLPVNSLIAVCLKGRANH